MDDQNFFSFLNGRIKDKGLNLKKISELSGISLKHLEALGREDFSAMPPAPYFRGYLIKLGEILDFDPDPWWSKIKSAGAVRNSGEEDAPPRNRFIKPQFLKFIWAAIVGLVVLLYISLQSSRILGKPNIQVVYPETNPAVAASNTITLKGSVSNWNELTLNGEPISVSRDGEWEKIVLLEPGLNSLELKAKKFLGGEIKVIEQIIYQPTSTIGASS
ncbi:MAG: helix-turn-helix domain-containing protein [Candidatus Liptonbacteria bacterium]|nr:helix-turn-helix domain-containing protein [Candidatus Liptonbacteria bacterium]